MAGLGQGLPHSRRTPALSGGKNRPPFLPSENQASVPIASFLGGQKQINRAKNNMPPHRTHAAVSNGRAPILAIILFKRRDTTHTLPAPPEHAQNLVHIGAKADNHSRREKDNLRYLHTYGAKAAHPARPGNERPARAIPDGVRTRTTGSGRPPPPV